MNTNNQSPPTTFSPLENLELASKCFRFLIESCAISMEVILRRGFGCHYLNMRAAGAIVMLLVYPAFWLPYNPRPTLVLLGLYLVMLFRARIEGQRRKRQGVFEHSRYTGYPRLMKWFPKLDETIVKSRIEPLLIVAVALVAIPLSPPLAVYLIIAAFSVAACASSQLISDRLKAQQTFDAMIETQMNSERVRSMVGRGMF